MTGAPVVIQVDGILTEEDAKRIRQTLQGVLRLPDPRCWVLVKGYHDSGTIDAVYGPYTEEYADWLLSEPLSNSYGNWTKVKLSSGPETETT